MIVINQVSPIYVTFAVPGRYLGQIRQFQAKKPLEVIAQGQAPLPPGAQAPPPQVLTPDTVREIAPGQGATMPVAPGLLEQGRVSFIDNAVDAQTGTIKMKATFDNADQGLWPGLFVQVTLNMTTEENAIVVPAPAVQPSASGQYVYVVKPDKTVEVRPITVLRQQGDEVVVAKGLVAGEEVVTDGQLRLTPGAQVTEASRGGGPGAAAGGAGRRGEAGNGERRGRPSTGSGPGRN
jgi:multidrug efflux system membrane fusion protein